MENTKVPVISAKNLNLWYGDFKALKGISLDVGEREIETFLTQFKSLWLPVAQGGVRPDGWTPPQALLARLMKLVPSGLRDA